MIILRASIPKNENTNLRFHAVNDHVLGARAELKWEQTSVELHPAANDKQAVGHFKYPRHPARHRCTLNLFTLPAVAPLRKARRKKCRPEKKAKSQPRSISAIVLGLRSKP